MGRDRRNEKRAEHFAQMIRTTMEAPAWRALSTTAQALYPWIKLEWRGPKANNNGKIRLSVRDAARRLGVEPHHCVVIEDAVGGVEAAKAAGMCCIAVTNTHSTQALAKADMVTDNLEGITGEALGRLMT